MINPVKSPAVSMRGMFNSDGRAVDRFLERKRAEKELEHCSVIHEQTQPF